MRNLEDCKTEVFRRSEERIKERKRKRNRVLACCIPLCLLLVAGGLYLRPLLEPVDEIGGLYSGGTVIPDRILGGLDYELYSSATAYSSVTITDRTGSKEVSRRVTDREALGELCGFLATYFDMSGTTVREETADGADGASGGKPLFGIADGATGTDKETIRDEVELKYHLEEPLAEYTLVFRLSTGEELRFRLHENYLYNESTGCVVTLSDDRLAALKAQLEQAIAKVDE